ncbi:hypothetical protein [Nesterenkonia pannonica]|uniref:hypothetical protein n=1 Tax=Nesterenkonia pannonica TaxID=1548602 RepID=UPI00216425C6|nr:hypothetical protein [Nesterenkonia pannonica]
MTEALVEFSTQEQGSGDELGALLRNRLPQVNRYFVAPEPAAPHMRVSLRTSSTMPRTSRRSLRTGRRDTS